MKECGLLFSAPMVRALLHGRKTQTRRLLTRDNSTVNGYSARCAGFDDWWRTAHWDDGIQTQESAVALHVRCGGEYECTYRVRSQIQQGDRIWVRETWAAPPGSSSRRDVVYRADLSEDALRVEKAIRRLMRSTWTPSIHMPKWASRINLHVERTHVERLHDVTEADAIAEGLPSKAEFLKLMNVLHGSASTLPLVGAQGAPAGNPWVWVIAFKVVERDAV